MRAKLLYTALASLCASLAWADYNPVALTPASFTQDIVVEKTAPPSLMSFVNATIDQGTNNYGNTFFEQGYIPAMPMFGLPAHGTTFAAWDNLNIQFVMPPDYTTNCAAFVGSQTIPGTSPAVSNCQSSATTVYLTTPTPATSLSFLWSSGGGGLVNCTVHHQDGAVDQISFTSIDWFNTGATYAWIAKGRVSVDGSGPLNTINSTSQTKLMHSEVGLSSGSSSPVTSIDFSYGNVAGGTYRTFVFAVSASNDGTTYTPMPLYGFNADCVIEANCPVKASFVGGANVTLEGGPSGHSGATFYEQGFATTNYSDQGFNGPVNGTAPLGGTYGPINGVNTNTGLPHPGSLLTSGNHTFAMPASYVGNCAVLVGNYAVSNVFNGTYYTPEYRTNTITFTSPVPLYGLSFLDTSSGGTATVGVTLNYSDGSIGGNNVGGNTITVSDWYQNASPGSTQIWVCQGRVNTLGPALGNVGTTSAVRLFYQDVTPTNTTLAVKSVTLTWRAGQRPFFLAVSGQTTSGGNFVPLAFTGYNCDPIVEAAQPLYPARRFDRTTTTIDLGLRNGNWTFFERGWVTNGSYAALGLPPAGSTINSLVNPTRHYQMPASYADNNGILVDVNHTVAHVTPVNTSTIYQGLSLLTAGGSIGAGNKMTNYCIVFHADGSAETNLFFGYDWFDTTVQPAFIAQARTDTRHSIAGSLSAGTPSASSGLTPRLFESFFALTNLNSPVTDILLVDGQTNQTTWTTYVLAASGTQDPVQPIMPNTVASISNAAPVTAGACYEGARVVITPLMPVTGTLPITQQWQFSPNNGATWVNLSDGPTLTGSTTGVLTISSAGYTNSGQYRLYACNVAGCTTNFPATLAVLSPIPDVTLPSDPVVAYQPNGGRSPANQTVDRALDNLLGTNATSIATKYLNFGANNGAPFSGPVGLEVTPAMGKTTVSVLRLYTANDAVERDPIDYALEGSNDGGTTWTPIAGGPLSLPAARTTSQAAVAANPIALYTQLQEVHFANTLGYASYRLSFANVNNNTTANSMQIGEVELLGTNTYAAPYITRDVVTNVHVLAGSSPTFSIEARGYPLPLTYQWYSNNVAIPGANGASYTVNQVQTSASGSTFYCVVNNPVPPAATSATVTLTVLPAPVGAYANAIMQDSPVAWYRLNEGPDDGTMGGNNGVTAYDLWGGHNGSYTNTILRQPGYSTADLDTSATFGMSAGGPIPTFIGPDSCVEAIAGVDFSKTNASAAFSIEAWVMADPNYLTPPVAGAGLITKGYGNGGEQFNLDLGGTGNGFRFFIRDSSGGTHGPSTSVVPEPGVWHHVVGVVDEAKSNVVLYIDGLFAGSGAVNPTNGILGSSYPVTIGARAQNALTNNNLTFYGSMDEVAIYNSALSSNRVMAHFLAAGIAPRFTAQPTNTTAGEGSTTVLAASTYGSPTIANQWYQSVDGGATFQPMAGKTAPTLTLVNVPLTMNQYQYYLQASNAYGTTNSATVTLTVQSGPPYSQQCPPANVAVYAGRTLSLAAQFTGTQPITYQWYKDGLALANDGRISGATSNVLSIANTVTNDAGNYVVMASNAWSQGNPSPCSGTQVMVDSVVDFNLGGAGWQFQVNDTSGQGGRGFDTSIPAAKLTLTDGVGSEATAAFYDQPLYIGAFKAQFTYLATYTGANGADGFAFVIQNDPRGPTAVGAGGGALAVSGIIPSAELEFNLFPNNTVGYKFSVNGTVAAPFISTYPVDLAAQIPVNMSVLYDGTTLTLNMEDAVYHTKFSATTNINLPVLVGTNVAWVGFSGATGGTTATQTIENFSFIPVPKLEAVANGNGTLTVRWPAAIGGYKLLETTGLQPTGWTLSAAPVTVVGDYNTVTLTPSGTAKFYKLGLKQSP